MREIVVSKATLLEKIKENREKHGREYKEAIEGYVSEVKKALRKKLKEIDKDANIDLYVTLARPEDHTAGYDQVISMLEMTKDEDIEISNQEFAHYVLDKWGWKENFSLLSKTYMSK